MKRAGTFGFVILKTTHAVRNTVSLEKPNAYLVLVMYEAILN